MSDSIKEYLNEISKEKLLSAEEEKELSVKAANGDTEAKKKLIKANLKLVVSVAKKYQGQNSLPLLDLIQEGNIGLMTAIDKFDPSLNYKFSTYAYYWIKTTIARAITQQSRSIRIPVYFTEKLAKFNKVKEELTKKKNGEKPTLGEIAKEMGVSLSEAKEMDECTMDSISLDSPVGDKEDETSLGSFVEDTRENINPADSYEMKDMKRVLDNVIDTLPEKESCILKMRFGIDCDAPKTLEEISKKMSMSRERARQLEIAALKKMRNPVRANLLKDYVI